MGLVKTLELYAQNNQVPDWQRTGVAGQKTLTMDLVIDSSKSSSFAHYMWQRRHGPSTTPHIVGLSSTTTPCRRPCMIALLRQKFDFRRDEPAIKSVTADERNHCVQDPKRRNRTFVPALAFGSFTIKSTKAINIWISKRIHTHDRRTRQRQRLPADALTLFGCDKAFR